MFVKESKRSLWVFWRLLKRNYSIPNRKTEQSGVFSILIRMLQRHSSIHNLKNERAAYCPGILQWKPESVLAWDQTHESCGWSLAFNLEKITPLIKSLFNEVKTLQIEHSSIHLPWFYTIFQCPICKSSTNRMNETGRQRAWLPSIRGIYGTKPQHQLLRSWSQPTRLYLTRLAHKT